MSPGAYGSASSRKLLRLQNNIRVVTFLGLVIGLIFLIGFIENLLASSLLALVLSYLFAPAISLAERRGVNRTTATAACFLVTGCLLFWGGMSLAPTIGLQVNELQAKFPTYVERLSSILKNLESKVEFHSEWIRFDLVSQLAEQLLPMSQAFFANLPKAVQRTLTVMILGPFLAFFLLIDGRGFSRSLLALVPNSIFEVTYSIYSQINEQLGQFIRARLFESAIIGVITWIGLMLIHFPFAAILAALAAVTNLIPYLGPILGLIPALIIAVVSGQSGVEVGMLLIVYFVAQLIDTVLLVPVVVAKIVDLHPVAVVLVIVLGAQLMGILGMLISIPVASALKVSFVTIFRHLTNHQD